MLHLPSIFIDPKIELNIILRWLYYKPKGYYQTAKKLLAKAKDIGRNFTIKDVREWLYKQAIWQIYSPEPKYIPQVFFNRITHPNKYHQADILYMPHDTVGQKTYKYCLNIIDVASRYKASIPLLDCSSASAAKAFIKVYRRKDCLLTWPKVLQVDGRSEFKYEVGWLMRKNKVRIRIGTTHENQSIVERYNLELSKRLFKIQEVVEFFREIEDTAWVKNFPNIVDDLNNSIMRLLGITPVEAIQMHEVFALLSKIHKDRAVGMAEKRLPVGSSVRYLLNKSDHEGYRRRATDPIWSTKIFTIESSTIVSRQPVMYRLVDGPKKYFVREQLLVVPPDT